VQYPGAAALVRADLQNLLRFYLGSLYRFGQCSGDPSRQLPAPARRPSGVSRLGMTQAIARGRIDCEVAVLRAPLPSEAEAVNAGLAALGFLALADARFDLEHVLEHVRAINAWYAEDPRVVRRGPDVTLTPEDVASLLSHAGDPRSEYWGS
jgi:hypothetical protein